MAAWNGLAITALAEASVLLDDPSLGEAAVAAATLLVDVHGAGVKGSSFVRASRDGTAGRHAAVLEDHGCVAEAFIAVLGITGDPVWLDRARVLLDAVLDRFVHPSGGFYDTADDAETLVVRPQDVSDNASPSGTSAVVSALVAFAAVSGEHRYREAAEAGLASAAEVARQAPRFAGWSLAAAEAMLGRAGRDRRRRSATGAGRPAPRRPPAHDARRGRGRRAMPAQHSPCSRDAPRSTARRLPTSAATSSARCLSRIRTR